MRSICYVLNLLSPSAPPLAPLGPTGKLPHWGLVLLSIRASLFRKTMALWPGRRFDGVKFVAIGVLLFLAAVFVALPTGCSVPAPDGSADTFGLDFSLPPQAKREGVVVFVVDGLNAEVFAEMLAAGELPTIDRYFVQRGLYAPRAVANIPSVTLANLTSLATGRFPGHHGVTGITWFDRNRLLWRNYATIAQKNMLDGDYTAPTIYEQFPDATTFSVFFQPHRGATKFIENALSGGPPFALGWYEFVDRLTLFRLGIVADVARKRKAFPAVTIVYLLAPDFSAYRHGVRSGQYRRALSHTDRQIGRVMGDLARSGLLQKLTIALTSDHGMCSVERHFPIEKFLRNQVGLDIATGRLWEQTPFEKRMDYYRRYAAVLYGSGDRYWALCLRKPAGGDSSPGAWAAWPARPSAGELGAYPCRSGPKDLIAELISQEAVDAVGYAPGPGCVRIRRKGGEVEFRQPDGANGAISYHLLSGPDPLGWATAVPASALGGEPMSGRDWLRATVGTEFPDLPAQLLAYFRAQRAGDIVAFAATGWNFRNVNRAGHGSLSPGDMCVPLLLAGPGVLQERLDVVRTVDLMPTLLDLLGRAAPGELDGRSLVGRAIPKPPGTDRHE